MGKIIAAGKSKTDPATKAGALLLIALALLLGLYRQQPPSARPADAPLTQFSSARAMRHLKAIAGRPHPVGSPEHKAVQQYILQELTALGISPEVQRTTAVSQQWGVPFRAATIENILARVRGTENSKALLVVAHYDSVPTGPGAADDGAAVAAMLETLRALKLGPPLKNDLIFLFSDGEEIGLLGAKAFVDEHAWAKTVGLTLNFEARGTSGPSIMFETTDRNGWLVREFVSAAPRPAFGNSFSYEVYKLLPNDTDLTVFREAGLAGLNFAFIDGLTHYHTMLDDVAHIDERSLQHHGSYALALARHFGALNLTETRASDVVYFDLAGAFFVLYSKAWVIPLTVCVTLLFIGVMFWGVRKQQLTISALGWGFLAMLLNMICAAAVVTLVWWIIRLAYGSQVLTPQGGTYHSKLYMIAFTCLALALFTTINRLFERKTGGGRALMMGGLLWWLALMILTSIFLPGCSYLFTWPLLFGLVGVGAAFALSGRWASSSRLLIVIASLCALPGIILLAPAIYQIYIALALGLSGAIMVLVILLLVLLIPHLDLITAANERVVSLLLVGLSLSLIVAASLINARPSPEQPSQENLFYALNADTQTALWASADEKRDGWISRFLPSNAVRGGLPEFFPSAPGQYLTGPAPVVALAAPKIELLDERLENDVRTLRMRVFSPRQAQFISVSIESRTEVLDALVNSKRISGDAGLLAAEGENRWWLRYFNLPPEGLELILKVKSQEPVKLRVVDRSYGLPEDESVGLNDKARPDYVISSPLPFSDTTMVSKSYSF